MVSVSFMSTGEAAVFPPPLLPKTWTLDHYRDLFLTQGMGRYMWNSFALASLATALGSSGDRPAALAELMGIIVNDGVRKGTRRIQTVRFAQGTPYETAFEQQASDAEQVLQPAVAHALKKALSEVVERGTARRLSGAFVPVSARPTRRSFA